MCIISFNIGHSLICNNGFQKYPKHAFSVHKQDLAWSQAAAEAAERRARDDIGCACGYRSGTDFSKQDVTAIEDGQPAANGASIPASRAAGANNASKPDQPAVQYQPSRQSAAGPGEGRLGAVTSGEQHGQQSQLDCSRGGLTVLNHHTRGVGSVEEVVDLTFDSDDEVFL